jgi:hypothetical protein
MSICQADNVSDNQIDNKAIDRIEQPCDEEIQLIFGEIKMVFSEIIKIL